MNMKRDDPAAGKLREDAEKIVKNAIAAVLPDKAVREALRTFDPSQGGKTVIIAVGKASWQMARAACDSLRNSISGGVVITKHGHSQGDLPGLRVFEAAHPVPDESSYIATREAIRLVSGLGTRDTVLFLLSGGGSSLFEEPLISHELLADVTRKLLLSGADIGKINTVRKRLSAVKAGRFALLCEPATVYSIILSDVLGNSPDTIASGPCSPDPTTSFDALSVVKEFNLEFPGEIMRLLEKETPKTLRNVRTFITGSVVELCKAAATEAGRLGYKPVILTSELSCEARDAGRELAAAAVKYASRPGEPVALIEGGETVVHVKGNGKGGRNQELVLAAAIVLDGVENVCVCSVGSDGTDGPTDAAGGYCDGHTCGAMREAGIDPAACLEDNDSYRALSSCGALIFTGPTGTNVNDLTLALVLPPQKNIQTVRHDREGQSYCGSCSRMI